MSSDSLWAADVDLSESAALNLISAQFPELAAKRISTLAEDRDGKTFELGGEWVFRFPKRREIAASLETELELLPVLAERLPVAVPRIAFVGRGSSLFPYSFIGYPKIAGVEARRQRRRSVNADELGGQIAAVLDALHAIPAATARACGVGLSASTRDLESLRDQSRGFFSAARRELPDRLAQQIERFLSDDRSLPEPHRGEPVLVHNDLSDEHLLLDANTGALTGIVDWGDAGLGDPALDLAGAYAWMGTPLLEAVIAHYHGRLDDGTRERARFAAVCFGIVSLAHGIATEDRERSAAGVHALSFAADDGVYNDK